MNSGKRIICRALNRAVLPEGALVHSACAVKNGFGTLIIAPSGGGKSTLLNRLVTEGGLTLLEDDETVLSRGTDGRTRCLPSHRIRLAGGTDSAAAAYLRNFVFLEKGNPPSLEKVSAPYALYRSVREDSFIGFGLLEPEERSQLIGFMASAFSSFPCFVFSYSQPSNPLDFLREIL